MSVFFYRSIVLLFYKLSIFFIYCFFVRCGWQWRLLFFACMNSMSWKIHNKNAIIERRDIVIMWQKFKYPTRKLIITSNKNKNLTQLKKCFKEMYIKNGFYINDKKIYNIKYYNKNKILGSLEKTLRATRFHITHTHK